MSDPVHNNDSFRLQDCPLELRVRTLESSMVGIQRDIKALTKDVDEIPKALESLRATVSILQTTVASLNAHVKISWVLLSSLILAIVGAAVALWFEV